MLTNAGRARAPLRMRLRSRPGRCCSEGCALQGLRFLARRFLARRFLGRISRKIAATLSAPSRPWGSRRGCTTHHYRLAAIAAKYASSRAQGRTKGGRLRMRDLNGKIAWVTGAGSGIGEAGAVALAQAGASVVLTGRRKGALEAVAERIDASGGGKAHVAAADLTKAAAVAKVAEAIRRKHGRLDILVHNAGTNIPNRTWAQLNPEGIDALIAG